MTARLTMPPAQRAALADALRHMAESGVRPCDLQRTPGVRKHFVRDAIRKVARP